MRRTDAVNIPGIHILQRVDAAYCMWCYGSAAHSLDEYLQMGEDAIQASIKTFCEAVVTKFGHEYQGMEELSHVLGQAVQRQGEETNCCSRGELRRGSLNMSHVLWQRQIAQ